MKWTSWADRTAHELAAWMRERITKAGLQGGVVGLSGGVDSAVVGALAELALPGHTLGVIMPCQSDPEDARLARLVAETLGITCVEVPLDTVFESLHSVLNSREEVVAGAAGIGPATRRLAVANIKPRLRMITLYYYANLTRRLVLGTGNMTELTLGYFTKHGDGGADLLPIGALVKREVYLLAEYLGVPRAVTERPPSAGLWPGQTDEAEIGSTYEELDDYIRTGRGTAGLAARVERLHAGSEHKRRLAPVGPATPAPWPPKQR